MHWEDCYQAFGGTPLPSTRTSPWGCSQLHFFPSFPLLFHLFPESWRMLCPCWVRKCTPVLLFHWWTPNITACRAQDAVDSLYFLFVTLPPLQSSKEDWPCDFHPVDFIRVPYFPPKNSLYYYLHYLVESTFPNLVMKYFGHKTVKQLWWYMAHGCTILVS